MSAKKTILILCDWFLPGYMAGGPIQSIATLTKQLGDDLNFKIITTDRDFKGVEPYKNITTNCWTTYEGRSVFYISLNQLTPEFLLNLIQSTPHDSIYLNSLFSKHFAINPLKWKQQGKIKTSVILAPRGMLGDGALAIKPLKKQLFLLASKMFNLFKNITWQSTSTQETIEIKKRIHENSKIHEISNLPNTESENSFIEKKTGELKIVFISRISEKKNLNFAIEILKEIKEASIIFDIYGPIEDELYWNNCLTNAKQLPSNISFHYKGILQPKEIGKTISAYHVLILPTQNENYGHIIVETLQHGRIVVLSDNTPWRNLEIEKVGYDIALNDNKQFSEAILSLIKLNQNEFDTMSSKCITYIQSKLKIEEIKQKYLIMFNQS